MSKSIVDFAEVFKKNHPDVWADHVPQALMLYIARDALMECYRAEVEREGILFSEFRILLRLFGLGEGNSLTSKELLNWLGVGSGGLSKTSKRLEAKGLLLRFDHPQDRRSSLLQITPEGERVLLTILKNASAMHRDFFSPLDQEENDALMVILKKLLRGKALPPTISNLGQGL